MEDVDARATAFVAGRGLTGGGCADDTCVAERLATAARQRLTKHRYDVAAQCARADQRAFVHEVMEPPRYHGSPWGAEAEAALQRGDML